MRSSVRVKPMRAVFRLTFSTWMVLPGHMSAAAHTKNAADDGSPGTSDLAGLGHARGR